MANPDPETPEESGPESNPEQKFHSSDYLNDAQSTDNAFREIVSDLIDLSMDPSVEETSRTDEPQDNLRFPAAPWVSDAAWGATPGAQTRGPRDWQDDTELSEDLDAFQQPDPPFELGTDPARNLGWFLTIFSLISALISYVFVRNTQPMLFAILGALFLAGVALLVWRMSDDDHEDTDSGARI